MSQGDSTAAGEQQLRAELADVRDQMLRDVAASSVDGRELLGALGPVVGLVGFGVTAGVLSGFPQVASTGDPAAWVAQLILLAAGLLLLYGGWWLIRPYARRRTADIREFRRLRRRELALLAQLPKGTTGPNVYWQYLGRFFGDPALLGLWVLGLLVVLFVLLAA